MSFRRTLLAIPFAFALAACSDDPCGGSTCPLGQYETGLYVVNAAPTLGNLRLYVDLELQRNGIQPRTSSGTVWLHPGEHLVAFERPGTGIEAEEFLVDFQAGAPRVLVAIPSDTTYDAIIATDTGSIVPAGATKLRVINAGSNTVDIWRTQPDHAEPVRIMTPFAFKAESPYLQSTPGTWTVIVTPRNDAATTPVNPIATASITLAAGQRGTMVLVPGSTAGTLTLVPLREAP